jgi:hypothetical protein
MRIIIKHSLFLLSLLMITSGCSWLFFDDFQKFDDEFKNSKKLIARVLLDSQERRTEINGAYIIFDREISDKKDITKAYLVISRTSSSFKVEKSGFLKADGKTFEIEISQPETEYKSKNETSVSTYAKSDSTGVTSGQTTDIEQHSWIDDKFMFTVTPEMISAIKETNNVVLRFYFGPVPATFIIKGSKLYSVHKALNEKL